MTIKHGLTKDYPLAEMASFRAWRLCATATEQADKTTSIKLYKGEEGVIYLAGDYLEGEHKFAQTPHIRNVFIKDQHDLEDTVAILPKAIGMGGKLEIEGVKNRLVGVKVIESDYIVNRGLSVRLGLTRSLIEQSKLVILFDTFKQNEYLDLMHQLSMIDEDTHCHTGDKGLLFALADGVGTVGWAMSREESLKAQIEELKQELKTTCIGEPNGEGGFTILPSDSNEFTIKFEGDVAIAPISKGTPTVHVPVSMLEGLEEKDTAKYKVDLGISDCKEALRLIRLTKTLKSAGYEAEWLDNGSVLLTGANSVVELLTNGHMKVTTK